MDADIAQLDQTAPVGVPREGGHKSWTPHPPGMTTRELAVFDRHAGAYARGLDPLLLGAISGVAVTDGDIARSVRQGDVGEQVDCGLALAGNVDEGRVAVRRPDRQLQRE